MYKLSSKIIFNNNHYHQKNFLLSKNNQLKLTKVKMIRGLRQYSQQDLMRKYIMILKMNKN